MGSFVYPSTPSTATSGSPGRIRSTTKMMSDTPMSVPRANSARRRRYFFTYVPFERRGGVRPPSRTLALEPDLVPPHDVVDPEVRRRVLTVHLVVPGVVDLLVADRRERGVLLEDVFRLAYHRPPLVHIELAFDLRGEAVELLVRPAAVVLGTVLAVPGREHVGRVHQ